MIEPSKLSQWIYEYEDIWQLDLLNPSKLATYNRDRKVDFWKITLFTSGNWVG